MLGSRSAGGGGGYVITAPRRMHIEMGNPIKRPAQRSTLLRPCQAGKKGGNVPPPDGKSKADFSAYWSQRVRDFFSDRRQYLEGGRTEQDTRPKWLEKLDARVIDAKARLAQLEAEDASAATAAALQASPDQLEYEAEEKAMRLTAPFEQRLLGKTIPSQLGRDELSVALRQARREQ
jgi:hypothetical protein